MRIHGGIDIRKTVGKYVTYPQVSLVDKSRRLHNCKTDGSCPKLIKKEFDIAINRSDMQAISLRKHEI
jgi:hypothetical protein